MSLKKNNPDENNAGDSKKWVFDKRLHKKLFLKSAAVYALALIAGFLVSSVVIHGESQTDKSYTALASVLPQTIFFDLTAFLSVLLGKPFSITASVFLVNTSMVFFLLIAGPLASKAVTKLLKSADFGADKPDKPLISFITPGSVKNLASDINSLVLFVFPAMHLVLSGFFLGYFLFVDAVFNTAEFSAIYLGAIFFLAFELAGFFNATAYALAPFGMARKHAQENNVFSLQNNYFFSASFAKVFFVSAAFMLAGGILESVFLLA